MIVCNSSNILTSGLSLTEALLHQAGIEKDIPVSNYLEMLYQMRDELNERVGDKKDPEDIIKETNKYLFSRRYGFFDKRRFSLGGDYYLLTDVLDSGRGDCLGLSSIYLALAEMLGLPIYGVDIPGHFFVRWDDNNLKRNISIYEKGEEAPDDAYIDFFDIPVDSCKKGIYLKSLSKKESFGTFLGNIGTYYYEKGEYEKAIEYYNKGINFCPDHPDFFDARGEAYEKIGQQDKAKRDFEKAKELSGLSRV